LCVELIPIKNGWGLNSWNFWNFLPGISKFGAKNYFFPEKKRKRCVFTKDGGGWLVGWATFRHVCHGKKIKVPLAHGSKRLHLKMCEIDNGNFID